MQFTKLNYEALKTQSMYVVLELSLFIYLFIASHVIFKGIYLSSVSCLPRAQNESIFMTIQRL